MAGDLANTFGIKAFLGKFFLNIALFWLYSEKETPSAVGRMARHKKGVSI